MSEKTLCRGVPTIRESRSTSGSASREVAVDACHVKGLPGQHCILEARGCSPDLLNRRDLIEDEMRRCIQQHGGTLINLLTHAFAPQGVTAVALLAESHMSIHTWPEIGYAAIDAFTCGPVDTQAMCRSLAESLGAKRVDVSVVSRGVDAVAAAQASRQKEAADVR